MMVDQEQHNSPHEEHPSLSTSMLYRVQQMQPDAWTCLVETFGPIVYHWCRQSGVRAHDSSDLVQDIFSSVARGIGKFERAKTSGSFRSWLATITRNRVRDYFRRDVIKHPIGTGGTNLLLQLNNVPDDLEQTLSDINQDSLEDRLPAQVLEKVRTEVEPRTWQAFWQTTVENRNPQQVAEELQMKLASVYQARSRVLRRLRARMDELP